MAFRNLIQIEPVKATGDKSAPVVSQQSAGQAAKMAKRGCEYCPLDKVKGTNKIFGKVKGKKIFIWARNPGRTENEKGRELVGKAGQFLWDELEAAGVTRDMCDIQNVVRCHTEGDRKPTKAEFHCCSLYTDKAVKKSKARVHLVFGVDAAQALLGKEYKKDKKVFWSDKLKAKVVLCDHPAFFLRGGSTKDRLKAFREQLKTAANFAKHRGSRYGYLEKQNYVGVYQAKVARKAYRTLMKDARRGHRIVADLEEGRVDKKGRPTTDGSGIAVPLVVGFCARPGTVWVYNLGHPDAPKHTRRDLKTCRKIAKRLLSDADVKKVAHHGSYDIPRTPELLGVDFRGYDYDTIFAEFFTYVDARAYGLSAIADRRFPQFSGYKAIVAPEAFTTKLMEMLPQLDSMQEGELYELARKKGLMNYALVPWKKMVLYNGGDCDITKRIEITTKDTGRVNMHLMHVYMHAGIVLARMEQEDAPMFDYAHFKKLEKLYPVRRDALRKRLQKLIRKPGVRWAKRQLKRVEAKYASWLKSSKPEKVKAAQKEIKKAEGWIKKFQEFSPTSPPQVSIALYKVLRLPSQAKGDEPPDTSKETLELLRQYHEFPGLILEFRRVDKICSTYLAGYKECADYNNGFLRTIWWLTGTRTGRLSSGGGQENKKVKTKLDIVKVVNLQNVHGDQQLQNLLVSDRNWEDIYRWWLEHGDFDDETALKMFGDYYVYIGFDQAQMELRVVAQKSGDKALIKIFSTKQELGKKESKCETCKKKTFTCVHCSNCKDDCGCGDPHSLVGHELTGWPIITIKSDEAVRRLVKNMQFGIVFGLNEDNLIPYMRAKGVTEEMASDAKIRKTYRKYFKRFKGVAEMIDNDRKTAERSNKVQTLFGFVRELNKEAEGGGYWANQAINTPIQGSAHQAMLMVFVALCLQKKKYKLLQHPQLEVHDALYFRVKLKYLMKAAVLGQKMIEREPIKIIRKWFGIKWKVPFIAEPKGAFRFGVQVKFEKLKERTVSAFLNAWCKQNKKAQGAYKCAMKEKHKPEKQEVAGKVVQICSRCGVTVKAKEIAA